MKIPEASRERLIDLEHEMKKYCEWSYTEEIAELYGNLYGEVKNFLDKNGIQR